MRRQRGFALVATLFLIIVLAVVGVFAVQIGTSQQQTNNFAILQNRALMAAYAGIEVGANRAIMAGVCPDFVFTPPNGALRGFTIRVTPREPCATGGFTSHTVTGVPVPYRAYTITSVATRGVYGTPEYVSRRVVRTVTNAPLP